MGGYDNNKPSLSPANNSKTTDSVLNLEFGDPTMYGEYWRQHGDKGTVVISGCDSMSYFTDMGNLCWFLEPELANSIKRLHCIVGNAVTEDRHIVVGSGSTQLYNALLYAFSSPDEPEPISVVCAAPYYSAYADVTDCVRSGLYKWAGDAYTFEKDGPYIEVVTTPNNPDGSIREAVVNRSHGKVIHDLAYYWPQHTPITHPADYDNMLFTFSKTTGHAGSRIGWAFVKDKEVARKMIEFIMINSIGVSKESQLRAAKIFEAVCDSCQNSGSENFFEYGQRLMGGRWEKLRQVLKNSEILSLPEYPLVYCNFSGKIMETKPAFAWLECNDSDCASFLMEHKIKGRGGRRFGVDSKYARFSLVGEEKEFDNFLERLSGIHGKKHHIKIHADRQ
ncbi:Alliinase_C domain-containing protein [Cephalotus follicularis]|uniref:Alliinase_C domain-containing protein n=1 Tax=Cephalotus follicularis TaxID=3775 RepID=A0A1Q3D9D2_CEPFO|nr:Alliinase_C domain-containing protein [Cephalotus follicularis]